MDRRFATLIVIALSFALWWVLIVKQHAFLWHKGAIAAEYGIAEALTGNKQVERTDKEALYLSDGSVISRESPRQAVVESILMMFVLTSWPIATCVFLYLYLLRQKRLEKPPQDAG